MMRAGLRQLARVIEPASKAPILRVKSPYFLTHAQARTMHACAPARGGAEAILQEDMEEVKLEPITRPNEPTEKKRARLLWQSRKRGILETCVILGKFAQVHLASLTREELDEYDKLMNENDWDIFYWVTESPEAPNPTPEYWEKSPLMQKIRQVGRNEEREIMRQPDLY